MTKNEPERAERESLFYVADFSGAICATRPKGREVAAALAQVAGSSEGMIEVNFKGCEAASAPFMQELLRECQRLGDRVIYSCLNEDVHATLTYVEEQLRV